MNEEQLIKWRLRCWLVIGLAIGFMAGLAVARVLDVQLLPTEVPIREEKDWNKVPESLRHYP